MKTESILTTLKNASKRLGIAEIVILALTGLVCWWLGWRTLAEYGTGLVWAGFAVMLFGTFSLLGGTQLNDNFKYQYSKSVMPAPAHDRAQQNVTDLSAGFSFATWAFIAGILTCALGYILRTFLA